MSSTCRTNYPTRPGPHRRPRSAAAAGGASTKGDKIKGGRDRCPNCGSTMKPDAVICVNCGFNRAEGKKLDTQVVADAPATGG